MNPGKLNKRIKFCGLDMNYKNAADEIDPKNKELFSKWASYKSNASAPIVIDGKQYMKMSAEITVRFDKTITDDMTVGVNDKIFEIDAIENVDEANKWLVIYCSVVS